MPHFFQEELLFLFNELWLLKFLGCFYLDYLICNEKFKLKFILKNYMNDDATNILRLPALTRTASYRPYILMSNIQDLEEKSFLVTDVLFSKKLFDCEERFWTIKPCHLICELKKYSDYFWKIREEKYLTNITEEEYLDIYVIFFRIMFNLMNEKELLKIMFGLYQEKEKETKIFSVVDYRGYSGNVPNNIESVTVINIQE